MHAMVLAGSGQNLQWRELPEPLPGSGEIRLRIEACGVCRTDLHLLDGELPDIPYPLIPGHEIVGIVDAVGGPAPWTHPGRRRTRLSLSRKRFLGDTVD